MKKKGYLLIPFMVLTIIFSACGSQQGEKATKGDAAARVVVNTTYMDLSYSEIYADILVHQEVVSGDVAMEIFSMKLPESTMELFRIYFGDESTGIKAGYLDNGVNNSIPVTYAICQYNDDDFQNEATKTKYLETMNCFNDIMNSLHTDTRFSSQKKATPVNKVNADLTYWSFSLPETMEYEEVTGTDQYEIHFKGNVAGEKIKLYTIFLGKTDAPTVLGTYEVNGIKQTLSVESYSIEAKENWSEEDTASAYAMMSTVNEVLQVIISDKNYSEVVPE